MHTVDEVFSQQDADTMQRKEAISEKKLAKGMVGGTSAKKSWGGY